MPLDEEHLARFKADLSQLSAGEMYERYVISEACMGLVDVDHVSLRGRIADRFEVPTASVVIVGSAKIGFTLVHKKANDCAPERPIFSPFYDSSDVDVAIVSDVLFDGIWKQLLQFWHDSGYSDHFGYWRGGDKFRRYHFRGWMRPDKLPSGGDYTYRNEWFDYFLELTSARAAGDYPIKAGVYREDFFLRTYQHIAFERCKAGAASL